MDAEWNVLSQPENAPTGDLASELDRWFSVSGDMDDFIYFEDNPKPHSEK